MKLFSKDKGVGPGVVCGAVGLVLGVAVAVSYMNPLPVFAQAPGGEASPVAASSPAPRETLALGIVDFDSLLKEHANYERLKQLDEQISILEDELQYLPLGDRRKMADSNQKKMQNAVEKARRELETEYKRVNAEMAGLSDSMSAQLNREGMALQEHYRAELERKVASMRPNQPHVPADIAAKMDKFLADLGSVRQQRVLARRLELERAMQVRIEAEHGRIDTAIAEYDTSVISQNQEKRVNLQLQLQVATTPEEEVEIQKQLTALSEDESQKKEAKSNELMAEYNAFVAREKAALEKDLSSYEARLNAEAHQQVAKERDRLLGRMPARTAGANQAEIEAQVEKVKASLNAEMEAKKAAMRATMEKRSQEARQRMEKKQSEIRDRLESLHQQLSDMVSKSADQVSDDTKKKMEDVKAKITDLKAQRKEVYDAMVVDLQKIVGEVAEKQNVPQVVGSCVVNVDCVDLTDLAMVAVKLAQH